MEPLPDSLEYYIKSGEYFKDARKWYNSKYLYPFTQRSMLIITCSVIIFIFFCVSFSLRDIFPIINQVKYSLNTQSYLDTANIIRANEIENDPAASIADIMVRNYIIHREAYDADKVDKQFLFIENNSTRIVFRKFSNYMNIDNPLSPMVKYQKYIRRSVEIVSVNHNSPEELEVTFNTIAKNNTGEIFENMTWQALVGFKIDEINPNLQSGSRFNFVVSNYRLKFVIDKLKK